MPQWQIKKRSQTSKKSQTRQRRTGKPSVAIVGAGNLGTSLALSLRDAGYRVAEVVARSRAVSRQRAQKLARRVGARVVPVGSGEIRSELVWICVPDREIRRCAETLATSGEWSGRTVFHASGALSSHELQTLQKRGAEVASVHPLMTFVDGVVPDLAGVPFAVEGDPVAVRMAQRIIASLGGESFTIQQNRKSAYHAWGAFASPLLISLLVAAERVAGAAGVSRTEARRRMLPILRQTLANYATRGPDNSFSGPIIRGDVETVKQHLRALRSVLGAREVYRALAGSALGTLPSRNRAYLKRLIH